MKTKVLSQVYIRPHVKRGRKGSYEDMYKRQLVVVRLFNLGKTSQQIAAELGVTRQTVWHDLKSVGGIVRMARLNEAFQGENLLTFYSNLVILEQNKVELLDSKLLKKMFKTKEVQQ